MSHICYKVEPMYIVVHMLQSTRFYNKTTCMYKFPKMCLCLFLHYLFGSLHLSFMDKGGLGFWLGAVGVGHCFFLFHLRVAFLSPPIVDWYVLIATSGVIGVQRRESHVKWWGTSCLGFLQSLCKVASIVVKPWIITSWLGQMFFMLACEGADGPYYHPSLSIPPSVHG